MKTSHKKLMEDLKKQYGNKGLLEIEADLATFMLKAKGYRRLLILGLYWIKHTESFRQKPKYKKETFNTYLFEEHRITKTTFQNEFWAYVHYEKAAEEFGPGLIVSIREKCGPMKVEKVLRALDAKQKQRKTPMGRTEIQVVVDRHRKPTIDSKSKPSLKKLEHELNVARETIYRQRETIAEQADQIKKLKATVRKYKEQAILEAA